MKIHQENDLLNVEKGVNLEVISLFSDKEKPALVFVKGLGGGAGNREGLVDRLAEDYRVVTFSPRNSGNSNGKYNIDNFVSDSEKVIDSIAQTIGKQPHGIGHSTGGYALAKLMEKKPVVDRAVLLAPLLKMDEQLPGPLNWYFRNCVKNKRNPFFLRQYNLDDQRILGEEAASFLESLYKSEGCDSDLKSPALVLLTGATTLGLPISNNELKSLKEKWESLGADVKVHAYLDHFFSGKWYKRGKRVFGQLEKPEHYNEIKDFLSKSD